MTTIDEDVHEDVQMSATIETVKDGEWTVEIARVAIRNGNSTQFCLVGARYLSEGRHPSHELSAREALPLERLLHFREKKESLAGLPLPPDERTHRLLLQELHLLPEDSRGGEYAYLGNAIPA